MESSVVARVFEHCRGAKKADGMRGEGFCIDEDDCGGGQWAGGDQVLAVHLLEQTFGKGGKGGGFGWHVEELGW